MAANVRLGLVGAGRWGRNYVAAAKQAGNCEVVQIIARDESREQLKPGKPEAYIVATPPVESIGWAQLVLREGFPLMIEKPVGLDVEDAEHVAMYERTLQNPIVLVNHQHLFAPAYEELHRRVKDVEYIQIATHGGDQKPAHDWPWLWDWAPHDVAMVLDLGGPEPHLRAVHEAERHVAARWQTSRGSAYSYVGVDLRQKARQLAVVAASSVLTYDDRAEHKLVVDGAPVEVSPELPLTRSLRAFAAAVAAGGTDDRRFGAHWGVAVARQIASISTFATLPVSR